MLEKYDSRFYLLSLNLWSTSFFSLYSHFLYPVPKQPQSNGDSGGDAPLTGRDGKYELFSQVETAVKQGVRRLISQSKF